MRPNGYGGAPYRQPAASGPTAHHSRAADPDQAGPDLLSPPGSTGPPSASLLHRGIGAPGTHYAGGNVGLPTANGQRLPPASLANGINSLSLNGGATQPGAYYSKPPVGGGQYVQSQAASQHQADALPPPRQAAAPGQTAMPSRIGPVARGPPAFGKNIPAQSAVRPPPAGPGSIGRPPLPASPNKHASIPMPAPPSPSASGQLPNQAQQQPMQMPLPPSHPRGLTPPSFNKGQPSAPGLNRPVSQPRQPSSKIDPAQVPRPSAKGLAAEEYQTSGNQYPNPPTTQARFIVRDTGNANPRYMRCTLSMLPYSNDLLKQSAMPLAAVVQPFAILDPSDDQTQTVDFGEAGPIRCGSCKAYMNPHMQFVDRGRKFRCCFCGTSNATPVDYICNTGADGRRHDAFDRPELCRGSVDFVASKEYMVCCMLKHSLTTCCLLVL